MRSRVWLKHAGQRPAIQQAECLRYDGMNMSQQQSGNEMKGAALRPGTLYLVATPIGNLEDITLRALRTLRECNLIAAEDTRRTGQLLKHFGISKPMLSCHQFNEASRSGPLLERLSRGETIALVSDAGSPGISDPGERVVKAVLQAGYRVEPVPGPSALVAALTASGLATDEFHFIGFLPHKSGARKRKLEQVRSYGGTLVLYESPYRVNRLLEEVGAVFGECRVVLGREISKKFEEFLRGTPAELLVQTQNRSWKGEFVVLVEKHEAGVHRERGEGETESAAEQADDGPTQ